MADVNYVGKQINRAKVVTLTVTTADTGGTVTFTGGNGQACVVTPTSTTAATAAADFAQALNAAGGVFGELQASVSGAVVRIEGPANGKDFTFSKTDGGTNSTTLATLVSPLSMHDAADVKNWSTGALPVSTTDGIVLENGDVDVLFNITALSALTLTKFVRKKTYTGRWGLPDTNEGGFPEYLTTNVSVKSPTYHIEQAPDDAAGQFRILNTFTASAVAITIVGDGGAVTPGDEVVEISGTPASSTADVTGGSLAIAPLASQAGTILTLVAVNSTVRVGPSATLSGTVTLKDCQAQIQASWTTSLTMNGGATEVAAAAGGVIVIEAGTMNWRSTGSPGAAPVIGSDGILDLSLAPAALTPSGTVQMYERSKLDDSAGRFGNFAFKAVHCRLDQVQVITKDDKTFTLS